MASPSSHAVSTICMLRHAEVDPAWRGRIYGALDVPLSEAGREQSAAAARALAGVPFRAVISSGLERAEHSAAGLRQNPGVDRERRDDARLLEIDRGDWAGWDEARVEAARPGAWREFWDSGGLLIPPGGEDLGRLQRRVTAALDAHAARFAPGPLALVAHKWVLRVAAARALDWPVEDCVRLDVPYAGMLVLEWPARPDIAARLRLISPRAHAGWLDR